MESKVDKVYQCKVVRLSDYKGLLTVHRESDNKEILSRDVGLSYGALFGPDIGDVSDWHDIILKTIDNLGENI